ncbi:MAG: DUF4241 domain-containing protein [Stenomitos rutilans HA7619-LM2]|jgi:hypothetical protein|nr:DUF4241 domain-containing protein [Stenomitos rutilans HA7619-LM2]
MDNINYSKAFHEKREFTINGGKINFTTIEAGELILTSGQLVACDPLTLVGSEPFTATLEPGKYPVLLSIAHIERNKQQEAHVLAYAMICVHHDWQQSSNWEMAYHSGEKLGSVLKFNRFIANSFCPLFLYAQRALSPQCWGTLKLVYKPPNLEVGGFRGL